MRTLIQQAAPDVAFAFSYGRVPNEQGDAERYMVVTSEAHHATFSVLEDSVWADVKRVLAKKVNRATATERWTCDICCEASPNRVSCNKCANDTCGECYIRALVAGQGVVVCPWCRGRTGQRFEPHQVTIMAEQVRSRLEAAAAGAAPTTATSRAQ